MTTTAVDQKLELVSTQEKINQGLVAFTNKKDELLSLAESSKGLKIESIDDKMGLKVVSDARKKLKQERVQIAKDAKLMRDGLTVVSRAISSKEKELIEIIEPVESELQAEEDRIEKEKETLRLEAEARENERIQSRIDTLAGYGFQLDYNDIKTLSDEGFSGIVNQAKEAFEKELAEKAEAERVRLEQEAKEKADKEAEELRMKNEREELNRQRVAQEEAQRKIEAESERIAQEYRKLEEAQKAENERIRKEQEAFDREAELIKARALAAEEARLKLIEDNRLAEEKRKADEEKKRKAAEKKAANAPERVKIQTYLQAIKAVPIPEMKTAEAALIMVTIGDDLKKIETYALKQIETL